MVFNRKFIYVLLVEFIDCWKLDHCAWQIYYLMLSKSEVVFDFNHNMVCVNLSNITDALPLSQIDLISNAHCLAQSWIGATNLLIITFLLGVNTDFELLTGNQIDRFVVSILSCKNLWSLEISHNTNMLILLLAQCQLKTIIILLQGLWFKIKFIFQINLPSSLYCS